MSVETGRRAETGVHWAPPRSNSNGILRLAVRLRLAAPGIDEVRGPAACMRRDALFRRMLLVADVIAILGAFLLTAALAHRSLQPTWLGLAAVPVLVIVA